ncbi:MAG: hypothetical protein KGI56_08450, partial [Acidobacteriota bacterium]|nr:hypothetical protein [Acidobacteriota bacterium]
MPKTHRKASTLTLVVWGVLVLALGLGAGLLLGQQGCGRRGAPEKHEGAPKPGKKPSEPKTAPHAEAIKPPGP